MGTRALLLLLLAGIEGEWDFHMVRPPQAVPRTCQADLELTKAKDGWAGAIRFRRILNGRSVPLAGIAVRGKRFEARLDVPGQDITIEGAVRKESLSGRLAWKGYATFDWAAHRPGLLFEPGLALDRDLPKGDAEKLGLDPGALAKLVLEARRAYSDALVVVKDGRLVCERTFGHPEGPIETMSVTKFVTAIGVAMLLEEGKIPSLDAPLSTWFPEREKGTLLHVLTHTSGIHHEKNAWELNRQEDRVGYVRRAAQDHEPGTVYAYNNDAVALLGGVFPDGRADTYLERKLFRPLGLEGWHWNRDAAGTAVTYAELAMRPRDLARIGRFVADDGRGLLSEEWIRRLGSPATELKKDQGLLWRLLPEGNGVYHTGWLGQWLVVYPKEKLVAVRLRRFEDERENEVVRYELGNFLTLLRALVR